MESGQPEDFEKEPVVVNIISVDNPDPVIESIKRFSESGKNSLGTIIPNVLPFGDPAFCFAGSLLALCLVVIPDTSAEGLRSFNLQFITELIASFVTVRGPNAPIIIFSENECLNEFIFKLCMKTHSSGVTILEQNNEIDELLSSICLSQMRRTWVYDTGRLSSFFNLNKVLFEKIKSYNDFSSLIKNFESSRWVDSHSDQFIPMFEKVAEVLSRAPRRSFTNSLKVVENLKPVQVKSDRKQLESSNNKFESKKIAIFIGGMSETTSLQTIKLKLHEKYPAAKITMSIPTKTNCSRIAKIEFGSEAERLSAYDGGGITIDDREYSPTINIVKTTFPVRACRTCDPTVLFYTQDRWTRHCSSDKHQELVVKWDGVSSGTWQKNFNSRSYVMSELYLNRNACSVISVL
eukprot:811231_1